MEVKGRDLVAGIPKTLVVSDEEVREALTETFSTVVEAVKIALERTPPELAADIVDKGVVVAGGGSLIKGLDTLLREATGLPITLASDALSAVAWPQRLIMAVDWLIVVQVLFQGPINRVEDGLIRIGRGGISDSPGRYSRFQYNLIDYLFPLSRFSQKLLKTVMASDSLSAYEKMKILSALMRLNWSCKCKTG